MMVETRPSIFLYLSSINGRSNNLDDDSFKLNLPEISSTDYFNGQLVAPTDLSPGTGNPAMLERSREARAMVLPHE